MLKPNSFLSTVRMDGKNHTYGHRQRGERKTELPCLPNITKKLLNLRRHSKAFVPAIKLPAMFPTLDLSQCLTHGGNRPIATLGTKDGRTRDKSIGTGCGNFGNIIDGNTAVDFQPNRQAAGVNHGSRLA